MVIYQALTLTEMNIRENFITDLIIIGTVVGFLLGLYTGYIIN